MTRLRRLACTRVGLIVRRPMLRYISSRSGSKTRVATIFTPKTFLWFIEEVGELATALNGSDRENLREEFADVLAWLCTLANINDVDLSEAIEKKYLREDSSVDPK